MKGYLLPAEPELGCQFIRPGGQESDARGCLSMEMLDEAVRKDPPGLSVLTLQCPLSVSRALHTTHTTTITPASCGLPESPGILCLRQQCPGERKKRPACDSIPPVPCLGAREPGSPVLTKDPLGCRALLTNPGSRSLRRAGGAGWSLAGSAGSRARLRLLLRVNSGATRPPGLGVRQIDLVRGVVRPGRRHA